jgi:hypothetical protein
MLLSLVVIRLAETSALRLGVTSPDRVRAIALFGGPLLVLGWVGPSLEYAHMDDVFALVAMTIAVLLCMEQRWVAVALAVGMAAAFKPWGFFLLPLTVVRDRLRIRGPLLALAVGLVLWLPFVIADRHTLDASHFFIGVGHSSSLRAFGLPVHAKEPWIRSLQFVVAIVVGAIAVRRGRWWLVLWLAFATRINLEPGAFGYYSAGPLVGAFVADFVRPEKWPASRTLITWFLLYGIAGLAADLGAGGDSLALIKIISRLAALVVPLVELMRLPEVTERVESQPAKKLSTS